MLKVYEYKNCSTCKKALNFLSRAKIPYEAVPIVETPPSEQEILDMIEFQGGNIKSVFNTSGQLYRQMDMKSQMASMTPESAASLLAEHGKMVKRPFVLGENFGLLGFKEDIWTKTLVH